MARIKDTAITQQSALSHKKTNRKPKSQLKKGRIPRNGPVDFPEVKGKTIEELKLFLNTDDTAVSILFSDRTDLTFSLEPRVTIRTDFSDWKTHNWRGIKAWPPMISPTSWTAD